METFPKFAERGEAEQERLQALKESFIHLCQEMKDKIEAGTYDALISDDTGGRIPTLLFRAILKKIRPEHTFRTFFVATGKNYIPKNSEDEEKLKQYLQFELGNSKNVLIVTQHIHSGDTINRLTHSLRQTGVEKVDVATIDAISGSEINCDQLFIGGIRNKEQFGFTENNNVLSGISKRKEYDPVPMRLDKAIEEGGQKRIDFLSEEEWAELLGYEQNDNWKERQHKINTGFETVVPELNSIPLSAEEKIAIQQNINKTRSHIKQLADEIVTEVWGK